MRYISTVAVAVAVLFTLPVTVAGQDAGYRTHDGFFLRFLVGGGAGSVVVDAVAGEEMTFKSSSSGAFHFQIGGAVMENLIIFGDLGGFAMTEPDLEWGGMSASGGDIEVTATGIGGGLTYYVMPINIYVSGSVLMVTDALTFEGDEAETETGPAFLLAVGKEWWVGSRWGLGASLFYEGGWLKDQEDATGYQADVRNRIIGIAFTATMN